jgi:hypothetical protein
MACIDGVIKFVTINGYVEQRSEDLKLTLWTLSSDFSRWDISKMYDVGNMGKRDLPVHWYGKDCSSVPCPEHA